MSIRIGLTSHDFKNNPQKAENFFITEVILWKPSSIVKKIFLILLLLVVLLIGYLDYLTGTAFEFYIFFAIPAVVSGIYLDLSGSMCVVALSFVVWIVTDCILGRGLDFLVSFFFNRFARALVFLLIVYFLIKIKRAAEYEFFCSRTDPLTKLYNRKGFSEVANKILDVCKKSFYLFPWPTLILIILNMLMTREDTRLVMNC